jgi:RNA polymerase sigma-32 factor
MVIMAREIDPSLSRYITMTQQAAQLTREDELELSRRWCNEQDPRAAEELVRAHLRYVVAIALKYRRYGLPLAELIAEGNFGVSMRSEVRTRARQPLRDYRAYWIRSYILNYISVPGAVGVGSGALALDDGSSSCGGAGAVTNLVGEGDEAANCWRSAEA